MTVGPGGGGAVFTAVGRFGPLITESRRASAALGEVKGAAAGIGPSAAAAEKSATGSFARLSARTKNLQRDFESAGKKLTTGITLPLAAGIGVSVKLAGDFQKQTSLLVTAAGETLSNLALIRKGILDISTSTGVSSKQLADGAYQIEKAGYRGAAALTILKAAAQGAQEEGVPLSKMAGAITSVMAAFKGTTPEMSNSVAVTNQIIAAAGEAKTTLEGFTTSLAAVLPVAKESHLSFAQVAGALATMTQNGTTADLASQHLAHAIRGLVAPNIVQQKAMQQFGLSAQHLQVTLGSKGLTGAYDEITTAILKRMGPSGRVLVGTFKNAQIASQDLGIALRALPKTKTYSSDLATSGKTVAEVAKEFTSGKLSLTEYRKAINGATAPNALLLRQILNLYNASHGFSDALKAGTPASKTYLNALKDITGGAIGVQTALQLTGAQAGGFSKRVDVIAKAAKGAKTDVNAWAVTQKTFNVQLQIFREYLNKAAIILGTALLPAMIQVIKALDPMLNGFVHLTQSLSKLSAQHPDFTKWIVGAGLVLAALGPILLIGGKILGLFGHIGKVVATAGKVAGKAGNILFRPGASGRNGSNGTSGATSVEANLKPVEVFWLKPMPVIVDNPSSSRTSGRVAGEQGNPGRGRSSTSAGGVIPSVGTSEREPTVTANRGRLASVGRGAALGARATGGGAAAGAAYAALSGGSKGDIVKSAAIGGGIQGGTVLALASAEKAAAALKGPLQAASKWLGTAAASAGRFALSIAQVGLKAAFSAGKIVVLKVAEIAIAAAQKVWAAATWLVNAALDGNPVVLITLAVIALVAAVIYAYIHFKTFRNIVNDVAKFMKTVFLDAIKAVVVYFKTYIGVVETVASVMGTAFKDVYKVIVAALVIIKDILVVGGKILLALVLAPFVLASVALVALWKAIRKPVEDGMNGLLSVIKVVGKALGVAFFAVLHALAVAADAAWRVIRTAATVAWNAIVAAIKVAFNAVLAVVRAILTPLKQLLVTAWTAVKTAATVAWTAIATAVGTAFNAVKSAVSGPLTAVKKALSDTWTAINTTAKSAWGTIVTTISAAFGKLGNGLSGVWDGVKTSFTSAINYITQDIINPFLRGINFILSKLGVSGVSTIGKVGGSASKSTTTQYSGQGGSVVYKDGGVTPGWSPGRDVHQFYSPTAGHLALSGGEAIMRPEWTRAVGGAKAVDRMNRNASRGMGRGSHSAGRDAFAGGGIWGGIKSFGGDVGSGLSGGFNAIKDLGGKLATGAASVVGSALHKLESAANGLVNNIPGGGLAKQIGGGALTLIEKAASKKVKAAAVAAGKLLLGAGGGTSLSNVQHNNLMAAGLAAAGLPTNADTLSALNIIISHESSWNPRAINRTDINAQNGDPSRGLMQTIGTTFEANRNKSLPDDIYNPLANIVAGLNYVKSRYGSLDNVPGVRSVRAGNPYRWYDSGGMLSPGLTRTVNATGKPEAVLTSQQWANMSRLMSASERIVTAQLSVGGGSLSGKSMANRQAGDKVVHIENVNVQYPKQERTSESLPSTLRRATRVAGL